MSKKWTDCSGIQRVVAVAGGLRIELEGLLDPAHPRRVAFIVLPLPLEPVVDDPFFGEFVGRENLLALVHELGLGPVPAGQELLVAQLCFPQTVRELLYFEFEYCGLALVLVEGAQLNIHEDPDRLLELHVVADFLFELLRLGFENGIVSLHSNHVFGDGANKVLQQVDYEDSVLHATLDGLLVEAVQLREVVALGQKHLQRRDYLTSTQRTFSCIALNTFSNEL